MNVDNDRGLDEHMEESGVMVADSAVVGSMETDSLITNHVSGQFCRHKCPCPVSSICIPNPHQRRRYQSKRPSFNFYLVFASWRGTPDSIIFPEHFKQGDMDQYS